MINNYILKAFLDGALKQSNALDAGGFGHAIWCNYPVKDAKKCNCGVADIQNALNLYIGEDENEPKK